MKISLNTTTLTPLESRAMAAFFNVMAGRQPVSPTDVADPEIDKMVSDFIAKVRDEPAPIDEDLAKTADTEDASGMAAAFDAIVPEVAKDANGDEWDVDRHSSPPKLTESGMWRKRRNVAKEVVSAGAEIVPETLQDKELEEVLSDPNLSPATVEDASNSGENELETLSEADGDADSTEPTFTEEEVEAAPQEEAEQSQEQQLFWHMISGARSWISFKAALNTFTRTPEFLMWHATDQRNLRVRIWEIVTDEVGLDVQPTDDPTAFSLWMPTESDADEVARRFKMLKADSEAYKRLPEESKKRMEVSVSEWIAHLIA